MNNQTANKILIIHNHSLYAQTVARAIRALNIYCELIFDPEDTDAIKKLNPKGIILVSDLENSTQYASLEIPLLTLNHQTAFSQEVNQALTKFLHVISTIEANWTTEAIIDRHIRDIKEKVGSDEVILALSGGVDSSVVAALLNKAIGKQLTCIFVDTGLMRLNEGDNVMRIFAENMGVKVIRINAETRFLEALKGEADPENKRKIIGKLFIDIFEEESKKLNNASWLAQGTIYPDILESMSAKDGSGVSIKSHHNVGGLPPEMNLKLIEPLSDLFKDEVRKLGTALGLPPEMVYRHPFPGPGLGVRILGAITKEYADILRAADAIFIEELRKADLYDKVSQAFVVFIPVKSVGIQKGERHYNYVISLRAIETIDFVIARAAHLPFEFIEQVSNRIILEVEGVSRVVYDVSNKPPATIEWE